MTTFASQKTQFVFQPDASQIVCEDIGFEKVQEYADQMSDEQLVQYIMAEAERFRQSRLKDLSECRSELGDLDQVVQMIQQGNADLLQKSQEIRSQQELEEQKLGSFKDQMAAKESESRTASEQLSDMNKILTSMDEQKAKFAKSCDNASLTEIKGALMRGSCPHGEEILDKITQFLTGNTKATFKNDGTLFFENETSFQKAVKKCDAAKNEKEWIRGVADSVNMNEDGIKGKLLAGISDPAESRNLIPFFPYFKVLFKLCQIGMTLKSKQSKQRREDEASKTMADL